MLDLEKIIQINGPNKYKFSSISDSVKLPIGRDEMKYISDFIFEKHIYLTFLVPNSLNSKFCCERRFFTEKHLLKISEEEHTEEEITHLSLLHLSLSKN
jgi:hypothetical protein